MPLDAKATDGQAGPFPRLLRVGEVAELLAISRSMAYGLVTSGAIRSVSIGRARRVRQSDLHAYVEARSGDHR